MRGERSREVDHGDHYSHQGLVGEPRHELEVNAPCGRHHLVPMPMTRAWRIRIVSSRLHGLVPFLSVPQISGTLGTA